MEQIVIYRQLTWHGMSYVLYQMKITEGEMTHAVEKASAPATKSSFNSPLNTGPEISPKGSQGASQDNSVPIDASALGPSSLKQEDGRLGKGALSVKPGKNETKLKEEFGYIVTNQRYN